MKTRQTRSKKTKRKSRFGGMGGTGGTRESLYNALGHYLGVIERVESGATHDEKPFIAIRVTVIKTFDDGELFVPPQADKPLPHHSPGDVPGNIMMETNVSFLPNWKNFMQIAADISDSEAEEEAGRLYQAIQEGKFPEDIAHLEEDSGDVDSFEDALDLVWEAASEEAYGDDQPLAGTVIEWVSNMRLKRDSRKKDPSMLTLADDYYTRTVYRKRLSYSDALDLVGDNDDALRRVLPDIDARVEAEAKEEDA